ncbi:sugar phosphate isomerase/epimerase [Patescibacteria group bacterium]|nr:sugar phosphate isomerase/epimerase [Patescibacteria group bacterium]
MKLSLSITDLPIGSSFVHLFQLAQEEGLDGVEIFVGIKPRVYFSYVLKLSEKFGVPILSLHQPFWSTTGIFMDEKVFKFAQKTSSYLVIHPPINKTLESKEAKYYFDWLSNKEKEYEISLLVENMPKKPLGGFPTGYSNDFISPKLLHKKVCRPYNVGINLDITHIKPFKKKEIDDLTAILPAVKSIHLSDFTEKSDHLPLGKGDLHLEYFFNFLKRNNYEGTITLEISKEIFRSRSKYYASCRDSIRLASSLMK